MVDAIVRSTLWGPKTTCVCVCVCLFVHVRVLALYSCVRACILCVSVSPLHVPVEVFMHAVACTIASQFFMQETPVYETPKSSKKPGQGFSNPMFAALRNADEPEDPEPEETKVDV